MLVNIKLVNNGLMPVFKRNGDACADCYSNLEATSVIKKGERVLIPLGFCLEIPEGYEAVVRPRSGLSSKGIDVTIGTIDSNYRGEVMACVVNNSSNDYTVGNHERICQLAIRKTEEIEFKIKEELSESNRGNSGFGSSGIL